MLNKFTIFAHSILLVIFDKLNFFKMKDDIVKEYIKDELTVVWQPNKCIHSAKCWRGLPSVFNPNEKPWIKVENATADDIIKQVRNCPSRALSIKDDNENLENQSINATEITVIKNGPLKIKGKLNIKLKDGTEENQDETYLCRCGQSGNKPFCDGTHKKCGFKDE